MTINVTQTGDCLWFAVGDAESTFAFEWAPCGEISLHCVITPDLVHVTTTYRQDVNVDAAIYMERRLAEIDGARVAFHDALFVSEVLGMQRGGFATEMLRRCIPYYGRLGIERVIIPSAVDAGRVVWPKFGFRPAPQVGAQFAQFAADLHLEKTGKPLPASMPQAGRDILQFQGLYGLPVGRLALEAFANLTLELDLTDPVTIDSLDRRGISIP